MSLGVFHLATCSFTQLGKVHLCNATVNACYVHGSCAKKESLILHVQVRYCVLYHIRCFHLPNVIRANIRATFLLPEDKQGRRKYYIPQCKLPF